MRRALELAWEAFRAGSLPVGAVLTDATGVIVAEGRNRIGEGDGPPGRLRGTRLAHAEMDVLAQLPIGVYSDHTLHTSLEPCLLCRAALVMSHVGEVHYLAADPLCQGLDQIPSVNEYAARWYPRMNHVGVGLEARFASVLPLAVITLFDEDGTAVAHYRRHAPDDAAAAQRIVDEHLWPSKRLELDAAIDALRPILAVTA
jgi:tRNA(Arg) A34 adenosine deaminase TadA